MPKKQGLVTVRLQPPQGAGPAASFRMRPPTITREDDGTVKLESSGSVKCSKLIPVAGDKPASKKVCFEEGVDPVIEHFMNGSNCTVMSMGEPRAKGQLPLDELIGKLPLEKREDPSEGYAIRAIREIFRELEDLSTSGTIEGLWDENFQLKVAMSGFHMEGNKMVQFDMLKPSLAQEPDVFGAPSTLQGVYIPLPLPDALILALNKLHSHESSRKRLEERKSTYVVSLCLKNKGTNKESHLVMCDVHEEHVQAFSMMVVNWLGDFDNREYKDLFHPGTILSLLLSTGTTPNEQTEKLLPLITKVYNDLIRPENIVEKKVSDALDLGTRGKGRLKQIVRKSQHQNKVDEVAGMALKAFKDAAPSGSFSEGSEDPVVQLEAANRRLQQELNRHQGLLLRTKNEKEQAEQDLGSMQRELQMLQAKVEQQEAIIKMREETIKAQMEELDDLRRFEELLRKREKEKEILEEQLAEVKADMDTGLQQKTEELREELDRALAEAQGKEDAINQMLSEKEKLDLDLEAAWQGIDDLEVERDNLEKERDALRAMLEKEGSSSTALLEDAAAKAKELEELKNELEKMRMACESQAPELERKLQEVRDLEDRLANANMEAKRQADAAKEWQDKHAAIKDEWDRLKEAKGGSDSELRAALDEIEKLKEMLNERDKALDLLQGTSASELEAMKERRKQDAEKIADLQSELKQLEGQLKEQADKAGRAATESRRLLSEQEEQDRLNQQKLDALNNKLKQAQERADEADAKAAERIAELEKELSKALSGGERESSSLQRQLEALRDELEQLERKRQMDADEAERRRQRETDEYEAKLRNEADMWKRKVDALEDEKAREADEFKRQMGNMQDEWKREKRQDAEEAERLRKRELADLEAARQRDIDNLKHEMAALRQERDRLAAELDDELNKYKSADSRMNALVDELRKVKAQLDKERREKEALERAKLAAEADAKRQQDTSASEKQSLERELGYERDQVARLKEEIEDGKKRMDSLREQSAERENALLAEVSDAQDRLRELHHEETTAKRGLERAEGELEALRARVESLEQALRDKDGKLRDAADTIRDKERQLQDLENELSRSKRDAGSLDVDKDRLREEVEQQKWEALNWKKAADEANAVIEQLRNEMQRMEEDRLLQAEENLRQQSQWSKEAALQEEAVRRAKEQAQDEETRRMRAEESSMEAHKEAAELSVRLDAAQHRLEAAEHGMKDALDAKRQAEDQLARLEKQLAEKEADAHKALLRAKGDHGTVQQELEALKLDRVDLMGRIEEERQKVLDLQEALARKDAALDQAFREAEDVTNRMQSVIDKNAQLQDRLNQAQADADNARMRVADLELREKELEDAAARSAKETGSLKSELERALAQQAEAEEHTAQLRQELEKALAESKAAIAAAEERGRERATASEGLLTEAEGRIRDLTKELDTLHAEMNAMRRDAALEQNKAEVNAATLSAELDEAKRAAANLQKAMDKVKAEAEEARAKCNELQRAVDVARQEKLNAEKEAESATSAAERAMERARVGDQRANAAEERATRAMMETEDTRREIDAVKAQAEEEVNSSLQREREATEQWAKEKRARQAAEASAATLKEDIDEGRSTIAQLQQELETAHAALREAEAKERQMEKSLWAAQQEIEDWKAQLDREQAAASDEAQRQAERLAAAVEAKRRAEELLAADQKEKGSLKMALETAQQQVADVSADLMRSKQRAEDAYKRLEELREQRELEAAANAELLADSEATLAEVQDKLRGETHALRQAEAAIQARDADVKRVELERDDLLTQLDVAQQDIRGLEGRLREKDRAMERMRIAQESAKQDADSEIHELKRQMQGVQGKLDQANSEIDRLRGRGKRSKEEAGDLELKLREKEETARILDETISELRRRLEEANHVGSERLLAINKLHEDVEKADRLMSAAADQADAMMLGKIGGSPPRGGDRLHNTLAALGRKMQVQQAEMEKLRDEAKKLTAAYRDLERVREDLEKDIVKMERLDKDKDRSHAEQLRKLTARKDALAQQVRELEDRLEDERRAAEDAAAANERQLRQRDTAARAEEARLTEALTALTHDFKEADDRLRSLEADVREAEGNGLRLQQQLERERHQHLLDLERLKTQEEAERTRAANKTSSLENENSRLRAALEDSKRAVLEAQKELDCSTEECGRLAKELDRLAVSEASAKSDAARLKSQLTAATAERENCVKREAEAAHRNALLDDQLNQTMTELRSAERQAEQNERSLERMVALLDFTDGELDSLILTRRLGGGGGTRRLRRLERDQVLTAMARALRDCSREVQRQHTLADLLGRLASLGGSAREGRLGDDTRRFKQGLAEWVLVMRRVAMERRWAEVSEPIENAVRAVRKVLWSVPDIADLREPGGAVQDIARKLQADLGGTNTRIPAIAPSTELMSLEKELAALSARPCQSVDSFRPVITKAEDTAHSSPPAGVVADVLSQLCGLIEKDIVLPSSTSHIGGFAAEVAIALSRPDLSMADLTRLSEGCVALDTPEEFSGDLRRLSGLLKGTVDSLLNGNNNDDPAVQASLAAKQLLQKVLGTGVSGDVIAGPGMERWDSEGGRRRMQSGLDGVEARLADAEREVTRLTAELENAKDMCSRAQREAADAKAEAAQAEQLAAQRLQGTVGSADDLRKELSRLGDKLNEANAELQSARFSQQKAEAERWDLEGRLRSTQNEVKSLSQTVERLQLEAEALRLRLQEADAERDRQEERMREETAAAQRKADSTLRDLQEAKERTRGLENDNGELQKRVRQGAADRNDILRKLEATERGLRQKEAELLDAKRRAEEAERQADTAAADAKRAQADAAEQASKRNLAENSLADMKRRAEASDRAQWASEAERDNARRRAEAAERALRQSEIQREKVERMLEAAEKRAAQMEALAAERLKEQFAASQLTEEVARLMDRLAASQRELQQARDNLRRAENERRELEGRLRTAESERQSLVRQNDKSAHELEAIEDRLRWAEEQANRARKADAERADALRRADAAQREIDGALERQRAAEDERKALNEKVTQLEGAEQELKRKLEGADRKLQSAEAQVLDVRRRAQEAEARLDELQEKENAELAELQARLHRTEAELEELRKGMMGGEIRGQLADALRKLTASQDAEADLQTQLHRCEAELAEAVRSAAAADELRSRWQEVNAKLDESESAVAAAEDARKSLEVELSNAKDAVLSAENRARDEARKAETAQREVTEARRRLREGDAERGELHEALLAAENARDEARRRVEMNQHQLRALQADQEDLVRRVKKAERECEEAESEASDLQARLQRAEAEVAELRKGALDLSGVRQQLADALKRLSENEQTEAELRNAAQRTEAEMAELRRAAAVADELRPKLAEARRNVDLLEDKLQRAEDVRKSLEGELASAHGAAQEAEQRVRAIQRDLGAAQREATDAKERQRSFEAECSELHERLLAAEASRDDARRRASNAEQQMMASEKAAEDARRRAGIAERRAADFEADTIEAQRHLSILEQELSELRKGAYEMGGLRQQLADSLKRLTDAEAAEAEQRSMVTRLEAYLRQRDAELAEANTAAAVVDELRAKLGEARSRAEAAELQASEAGAARAHLEADLNAAREGLYNKDGHLRGLTAKLEGTQRELEDTRERARKADIEYKNLHDMLHNLETDLEEATRRADAAESEVHSLRGALEDSALRTTSCEKRADQAEKKQRALQSQVDDLQHRLQTCEHSLGDAQRIAYEVGTLRAQLSDAQRRIDKTDAAERDARSEIARLQGEVVSARRVASSTEMLEEDLQESQKRLAACEAKATRNEELVAQADLELATAREALRKAEQRAWEAENRNGNLTLELQDAEQRVTRTNEELREEIRRLADRLNEEVENSGRVEAASREKERHCHELARGVERLQMQLEKERAARVSSEELAKTAASYARMEQDAARAVENAKAWEAEARALHEELQQVDHHVASLARKASVTATTTYGSSSTTVPGSAREIGAEIVKAARGQVDVATVERHLQTVRNALQGCSMESQRGLERAAERLTAIIKRGSPVEKHMYMAVGEALMGGSANVGSNEGVSALESLCATLQRGGNPSSSEWAKASQQLKVGAATMPSQRDAFHMAAECVEAAARQATIKGRPVDHPLMAAVHQGLQENGWRHLAAVSALSSARPATFPTDNPTANALLHKCTSTAHLQPEAASLAVDAIECLVAADPATLAVMSAVASACRGNATWSRPSALCQALERASSAATDASSRTALRTASQRVGRCPELCELVEALQEGRCDPKSLLSVSLAGAPAGLQETVQSVGDRLTAIAHFQGWEVEAAAILLKSAILCPPHAPHFILSRLRTLANSLKFGGELKLATLQQIRDDTRSAAAQLYDVPQVQSALRKTSEAITSMQRQITGKETETWPLMAIAANLANALTSTGGGSPHGALIQHLREAEAKRAVSRLVLSDLVAMCEKNPAPHQEATYHRLRAMQERAEGGGITESWEIATVREAFEAALEGALPHNEAVATRGVLQAVERRVGGLPLRTSTERGSLQSNLAVVDSRLNSLDAAAAEIADLRRKIVDMEHEYASLQGEFSSRLEAEREGAKASRARLRDIEVALARSQAEVADLREREDRTRHEMDKMRRSEVDETGRVRKLQVEIDELHGEFRELVTGVCGLWRHLAPILLPNDPNATAPSYLPTPADLSRLALLAHKRLAVAMDVPVKLRKLVASYLGVLGDSVGDIDETREDLEDLEDILRLLSSILDKLMDDVEKARETIIEQNELLRAARHSVAASTGEIADLTSRVSPQRERIASRPVTPHSRAATEITTSPHYRRQPHAAHTYRGATPRATPPGTPIQASGLHPYSYNRTI